MTLHPALRRAAINFATFGLLAALLSACTLRSEANLIAPGETVQPLRSSFAFTGYAEAEDNPGTFAVSSDKPAPFALTDDGGYVVADKSMTAYFAPTDAPDTYVVALEAKDGTTYGVARVRGDLMELAVIYKDGADARFAASGLPVPSGVTVSTEIGGGVILSDRAALDAMIALHRAGTITLDTLISHVGAGAPPASLRREGDWYVPG